MSVLQRSSAGRMGSFFLALDSIAWMTLSSALREATTLLYAEAQRLRSGGTSSSSLRRIWSAKVVIQSKRSVCCASLARRTQSYFLKSLAFIYYHYEYFNTGHILQLGRSCAGCQFYYDQFQQAVQVVNIFGSVRGLRQLDTPPAHCLFLINFSRSSHKFIKFVHICYMSHRHPSVPIDGRLHHATFQAHVSHATTSIKFPCLFYILWKTNDHQYSSETSKHDPHGERVTFNETITLKVPMVYERTKQVFLKKETQVQLNLVSKNRPDQSKLVGRVTIDLANLLNNDQYSEATEFPLQFCSVNASLTVSFRVIERIQTDTSLYELQKSIAQGASFSSALKGINLPSILEKSRDSGVGREPHPTNSQNSHISSIINDIKSRGTSPKSSEYAKLDKDITLREKKEMSSSTTQENKEEISSKSRTKSFSGAKMGESVEKNQRQQGTFTIDEASLSDEVSKLRGELEALRLQNNRQNIESDKLRKQLESKNKENQFVKLQLRQKQTLLDQSNAESTNLRNEAARHREEVSRLREEGVSATIKFAQLKDNFNRVSTQLATSERQMKRLELGSEQTNNSKRQLSQRIEELQHLLSQSQVQCNSLESHKSSLQVSIRKLEEALQVSQEKEKGLIQANNEKCTHLQEQIRLLQNQLKGHRDSQQRYLAEISCMEEEIKRLSALEHEFEEAKNSWAISQDIVSAQSCKKDERITELEETLMSINQRVRQLEGQKQLLADSYGQLKAELDRLESEKEKNRQEADLKYQECYNTLEQERNRAIQVCNQKQDLQTQLQKLSEDLDMLSKQHQALNDSYSQLFQQCNLKDAELLQEQNKKRQLEQLLLSANEQRERELSEALERQNQLSMKLIILNNELQSFRESGTAQQAQISILDQELRAREELIVKLQQGLTTQIERTESLNLKLVSYLEKDERMKDLLLIVEQEQNKITQLIEEQEQTEITNSKLLKEREEAITQLLTDIEINADRIRTLQLVLDQKENQHALKLEEANSQLAELNQKNHQLARSFEEASSRNQQLLDKLAEAEQHLERSQLEKFQFQSDAQAQIERLEAENIKMDNTITQLEYNLGVLNAKIVERDALVVGEQSKAKEVNQQLLIKEIEVCELNQQITQLGQKLAELEGTIADRENQILLKQELLQEENKRYNEIQSLYEELANEQATFDIRAHQEELKQKVAKISQLEEEVGHLQAEIRKMAGIQRALKIKTIELNSLKFKGKGEVPPVSELVSLKDEEIASLQAQNQKLLKVEKEFVKLQEQVQQLKSHLEEIEQDRFNVQSLSNERALMLEEAKEQNRKLMEEITIIGEKHGELEKIIFEMASTERSEDKQHPEASLKAENYILKEQLKDYQLLRRRTCELEQKLLELHHETDQKELNNKGIGVASKDSDLGKVYRGLKSLLEERRKDKWLQQSIRGISKVNGHEGSKAKAMDQKIRELSKILARLKVQVAQKANNKPSNSREVLGTISTCQSVLSSLSTLVE